MSEGYPVSLNVYDLSGGWVKKLSEPVTGKEFEGMWHTGVVVFGLEYFWSADLMCTEVGKTPYGKPVHNIPLGTTHLERAVVDEYVNSLRPQYNTNTYSLLSKNCNNFSNELSLFLLGHGIPQEITNLPQDFISTPFGAVVKPIIESIEQQQKAWALSQQQGYTSQSSIFYPPSYAAPSQQQSYNLQPNIFYPPSYTTLSQQQDDTPQPGSPTSLQQVNQQSQQQTIPNNAKPTPVISFSCNPKVFITKLRSTGKVSAGVIGDIRNAVLDPSSCAGGLAADTHTFFEVALWAWPLSECTAPLFLLRGIATHSFFPAHYFNIGNDNVPVIDEGRTARLCKGLNRQIVSKDKTCTVLGIAVLMNLFATPCGEAFAKTPSVLRNVFAHTLDNLDSEDPDVRKMAAALAYNYASSGPFKDEALGATCAFRLSVAIVKKYPKKSVSEDASVYSLAAFKCMLVNNPALEKSMSRNPQLTSHILSLAKARGSPKVSELAKELCAIMNIQMKPSKMN